MKLKLCPAPRQGRSLQRWSGGSCLACSLLPPPSIPFVKLIYKVRCYVARSFSNYTDLASYSRFRDHIVIDKQQQQQQQQQDRCTMTRLYLNLLINWMHR